MSEKPHPNPFRRSWVICIALCAVTIFPLACTKDKSTDSSSNEEGAQVSENQAPAEAAPAETPHSDTSSGETARPGKAQPRSYGSEATQPAPPAPVSVHPSAPETTTLTVPEATQIRVKIDDALDSATSQPGDHFQATLVDPVVVGDRVALPAGSTIEGTVSDVIPAKKGLKESAGSLTLSFDRVSTPAGEDAPMNAAITQAAKSTKKKAGTIAGSAAGGALLGKILGKSSKDAAIGAVLGGAVGTGIAAGTKGSEMKIEAGTEMSISLQQPLTIHLKR